MAASVEQLTFQTPPQPPQHQESSRQESQHQDLVGLIWSIADKLRGPYRPPQYRRVMLPLIVLRRSAELDLPIADFVSGCLQKSIDDRSPYEG